MAEGEELLPPTIEWLGDRVRLIDQRVLPRRLEFVEATTVDQLCEYIRELAVRGAPALGAAGAMGVALAVVRGEDAAAAAARISATRPTAVNLGWGRVPCSRRTTRSPKPCASPREDVERNRALGAHGAERPGPRSPRAHPLQRGPPGLRRLRHRPRRDPGRPTRPGSIRRCGPTRRVPSCRAPASPPWELQRLGIPCTVIPDVLAASLMASGEVDAVVVGADRIAANGDVANKVGTYGVAVVAARHGIPFYVAAPTSTIDASCPSGADIVVERRDGAEVAAIGGERLVPDGVAVENRAFDVTPAELVTAWITEEGVVRSFSE